MSASTVDRSEAGRFSAALRDPEGAQEALLATLLRRNAHTQYGELYGFGTISDLAEYRRRVPCVRYDDLAPRIDRMLAGDADVLLAGQPVFFARTSGTTGAPKHIGYAREVRDEYAAAIAPIKESMEARRPGITEHTLSVGGGFIEDRTPAGVPIGSASGFVRNLFTDDSYLRSAPEAVYEAKDHEARYYALLRIALARPLRMMFALNPSTVMTLLHQVKLHGEALVADLAEGGLARVPGSVAWAAAVGATLPPAPEAAARLREALRDPSGFAPSVVWPRLEVIETWKGGASIHYVREMKERIPGVTIRPAISGSSEGVLMLPLDDDWMGGVPALRSSVLEFLPEDEAPLADNFVGMRDLDDSTGYRVVLTNGRGLYRYLMDDVFLLEGRHEGVPILRFSHRHGVTSSLTGEKLTEAHVIAASEAAIGDSPLHVGDYQLVPAWGDPPGYVLLLETSARASTAEQARWLASFERNLCAANQEYAAKRASGRLAPPELVLLREGAFIELARRNAGQRSDAQVKTARLRRDLLDRASLADISVDSLTHSDQSRSDT